MFGLPDTAFSMLIIASGFVLSMVFLVLLILIPINVYLIQKWAKRSYKQLESINQHLLNS